jgi:hypothetical protein
VLGSALRTDRQAFRRLVVDDPVVIELREWSRMADELQQERTRLANRVRQQLWRYYPQATELTDDVADDWFLALWQQVPTPTTAAKVSEKTITRILKHHRIRRVDATTVLLTLRKTPLFVAPGTTEAACAHIRNLAARLHLVNQQIKEAHRALDGLCARLEAATENPSGQIREQHDVTKESAESSSPRCSPRPRSLCADEITTPCGLWQARLRSPGAAANNAS